MDQFFAFHTQTLATVDGVKNCFAVLASGVMRCVARRLASANEPSWYSLAYSNKSPL